MKTPTYAIEAVDREAPAEEAFHTSGDGAICGPERLAAPIAPIHSMDYQWYEVPAEELISLMAVCAAGDQN
jgi:hypothetical protein